MVTVSVCMIVKNEAPFLPRCLSHLKEYADEIIVVDTGSTDTTVSIARSYTPHVFRYVWKDDFSDARNFSLTHATGDWILVLDADEVISPEDFAHLRGLVEAPVYDAYTIIQRNYTLSPENIAWVPLTEKTPYSLDFGGYYDVTITRLFRNHQGYTFQGVVHEDISPSIVALHKAIGASPIVMHHYQAAKDSELHRQKKLYYLTLLEKKVLQFPTAKTYHDLGILYKTYTVHIGKAISCFEKVLELEPTNIRAYINLSSCYATQGKIKEALLSLEKAQLQQQVGPYQYTIYTNMGTLYLRARYFKMAIDYFQRAISINPSRAEAYINLGGVYYVQRDFHKALDIYTRGLEHNPQQPLLLSNIEKIKQKYK